MLLVPKKYYHILDNNFKLNHESWTYYKMKYKLSNEDMTFMSDLMFDSNSYLDYNPYYIISGRPENKIFHNTNKTDPTVYGKVVKDCKIHPKIKSEYLHNPAEYYFMNNKNYYE